jgi:hypothetical protein
VDKVNAELVTLTYGTMVAQLCKDYDGDYGEVNKQLDKMGYNIGLRLIEDFFAKSNTGRCADFKETAEVISKVNSSEMLVHPAKRELEADSVYNCFIRSGSRCSSILPPQSRIGQRMASSSLSFSKTTR